MGRILKIIAFGLVFFMALFFIFSCGKDEPTCTDGIQNGTENGIDCGGVCSDFCIGAIGPANGIVFYDKGEYTNGWRFLEAAPSDQTESSQWGCSDRYIGSTSEALGYGSENTTIISTQNCGLITSPNYQFAAKIAENLSFGNKSDWFLPSKEELDLMFQNHAVIGQLRSGQAYWTSSETSKDRAWFYMFEGQSRGGEATFKTEKLRVRAIRRF